MAERADRPRALAELESALASLDVADRALGERRDQGAWVADWGGDVRGHDVYLLLMGADNHPDGVRLMLDDFTFEEVRTEHLKELVQKVFTGDARITRSGFLRLSRHLELEVRVGTQTYTASVSGDSADELSTWARPLVTS
ncbi:hypothetical protein [Streptomyces sp. enrichment culture]|uniref:hypothetical protein n=1 Tax=Streptomyces sp. enrichment culture TaxID=1795815 RepID=UPI003F56A856